MSREQKLLKEIEKETHIEDIQTVAGTVDVMATLICLIGTLIFAFKGNVPLEVLFATLYLGGKISYLEIME